MLQKKTIHELRAIAEGMGVSGVFSKDKLQLVQAIEFKQHEVFKKKENPPPRPEYDARLMQRPPSKATSQDEILKILDPHTQKGLKVTFPDPETWHMIHGKREDTGSVRIPLRTILGCAEKVMS